MLHQIAAGMEGLAAEGLVHRDLAMRNVLVFAFDPADPAATRVKVSDFGLAVSACVLVSSSKGSLLATCHFKSEGSLLATCNL